MEQRSSMLTASSLSLCRRLQDGAGPGALLGRLPGAVPRVFGAKVLDHWRVLRCAWAPCRGAAVHADHARGPDQFSGTAFSRMSLSLKGRRLLLDAKSQLCRHELKVLVVVDRISMLAASACRRALRAQPRSRPHRCQACRRATEHRGHQPAGVPCRYAAVDVVRRAAYNLLPATFWY